MSRLERSSQIYVVPLSKNRLVPLRVHLKESTLGDLKRATAPQTVDNSNDSLVSGSFRTCDGCYPSSFDNTTASGETGANYYSNNHNHNDDDESFFYLSAHGRPLHYDDNTTLEMMGIKDGDILRCNGRLRGGGMLPLKIRSKFGCLCCNNHCSCDCCSGREYLVNVSTITDVQTIFEAIALQNPKWKPKKARGTLFTKKGQVLEPDRKILMYDLSPNDELIMYLSVPLWFTSEFRSGETTQDKEELDQEVAAELAARSAAAAGATGQQNQQGEEDNSNNV